jgi:hypothetical protein
MGRGTTHWTDLYGTLRVRLQGLPAPPLPYSPSPSFTSPNPLNPAYPPASMVSVLAHET